VLVGEEDERDLFDSGVVFELCAGRSECDLGGTLHRIAEDARGDRRERNRAAAELGRDLERSPVTRGQELGLVRIAALPDRSDGMDHVFRRQVAGCRRLRVAGRAAAEEPRLGENRGAAGSVDRPVDAASSEERRVRRVHDCVRGLHRDVALDELDPAHRLQPTVRIDERR